MSKPKPKNMVGERVRFNDPFTGYARYGTVTLGHEDDERWDVQWDRGASRAVSVEFLTLVEKRYKPDGWVPKAPTERRTRTGRRKDRPLVVGDAVEPTEGTYVGTPCQVRNIYDDGTLTIRMYGAPYTEWRLTREQLRRGYGTSVRFEALRNAPRRG